MTQRFLCPNHRQWLQTNPSAANAHFADTQDTGQWYREQGLWQQALPYVGCAYETAEIVLSLQARGEQFEQDLYLSSQDSRLSH